MKKNILSYIIFPLVFVFGNLAFADTSPVHEYTLPNGLTIIVKEDHRAPMAVVQVWYKVGSSYEATGTTGISHALEHMMFEGSKNYPDDSYTNLVSANGGQINAMTTNDYTFYYQMIAADKIPLAFQLEADRMQNLTLSPEVFAKEIEVVKEERRMRIDNDPQNQTYVRFNAAAFISSPYHVPTIGWMDDLNHMTVQDLRDWYNEWYAPNNAILIVVGDVDPNAVYRLAQQYFGPIQPKVLPKLLPTADQTPLGMRYVNVTIPAKLPWLLMGYNVPSLVNMQQKWQAYALVVLSNILAGNESSRLNANLIRGQQIATDADSDYEIYSRLPTVFLIAATPNQGHSNKELEKAILTEIKQLQTTPVSEQELTRIKNQIIAQKVFADDSASTQGTDIGEVMSVGLPWQEIDNYNTQIEAITAAQIQAVAKMYLIPDRLTVATLSPLPLNGQSVMTTTSLGKQNVQ